MMNNRKKTLSILLTIAILPVMITGCSSGGEKATPFQMAFCGLYMDQDAVTEYGKSLSGNMPELFVNDTEPIFTSLLMGEAENDIESGTVNDPMMAIGGTMKFATLIASGELDIVVSDMENAARNARSDSFMPLSELFSDDELANMQEKLLSFDLVETDGYEVTPTGEKTPVCGIDITGNQAMKSIYGDQEIGVFIIANTKNKELAKEVIFSLLN